MMYNMTPTATLLLHQMNYITTNLKEFNGQKLSIDKTVNRTIAYLKIEGDTRQTGTPSPSNPSPLNGVNNFDLITTNGADKTLSTRFSYTLNKLPNGVCDYIEIDVKTKTAKRVQKVGLANGTENWLVNSMASDPDNMYLPAVTAPNVTNNIRCTHLPISQSGLASSIYTNTPEQLYYQSLSKYGVAEFILAVDEAFDRLKRACKIVERVDKRTVNGVQLTMFKCYYGSSTYDTKEMSLLIDGILDELEQTGIDTAETRYIAEEWNNAKYYAK